MKTQFKPALGVALFVAISWIANAQAKPVTDPTAGSETQNGGDACKMSIPVIKEAMSRSLMAQGQNVYPEFEFGTLKFFIKRAKVEVVAKTTDETGQESDATSFIGSKLIQVSRTKWCHLSPEKKAGILFHEYLVLMEIEKTGVYDVSSRFVFIGRAEIEQSKMKRWVCSVPGYNSQCLVDQNSHFCSYAFRPLTYLNGNGISPEVALESALKNIDNYNQKLKEECRGRDSNYCDYPKVIVGCFKIIKESNGAMYCSEPPTIVNSCVDTLGRYSPPTESQEEN